MSLLLKKKKTCFLRWSVCWFKDRLLLLLQRLSASANGRSLGGRCSRACQDRPGSVEMEAANYTWILCITIYIHVNICIYILFCICICIHICIHIDIIIYICCNIDLCKCVHMLYYTYTHVCSYSFSWNLGPFGDDSPNESFTIIRRNATLEVDMKKNLWFIQRKYPLISH